MTPRASTRRRVQLLLGGLALGLALFLAPHTQAAETFVKQPVADFTAPDVNGKQVKFSSFKGKVIVVDFWATWCPPCKAEIPHFIALQKKYKDKVQIVGIAISDEASEVKAFVQKNGINYPILMGDENISKKFGEFDGIPTTFFMTGGDRKIKAMRVGYHNEAALEKEIKALLEASK